MGKIDVRFPPTNRHGGKNERRQSYLRLPSTDYVLLDNETVVLHIIDKMIKQGNNDDLINKIAAVTSKTQTQKGEVAEFQALLHAHLRRFSPQEL